MGLALNYFHTILLLLSLAAAVSGDKLETYRREYGPFEDKDKDVLEIVGAEISKRALQVTPESPNDKVFSAYNRYGRVLLKKPFKLWADKSSSIASFNISFLINIFKSNESVAGDGLAFVIAPDLEIPSNSSGQYLGLTNFTTDGNPANRLVAVELDTFKDSLDPDANHVGLNINSVRSKKNESLTPQGIELAPDGDPRFHVVWVQYDGVSKMMEVYVDRQPEQEGPTPPRPDKPLLSAPLDLRQVVNQKSYFGFSASTGSAAKQSNCVLRWNLTVEFYAEDKLPWVKIVVGAGVSILAVLVMAAAGLGYFLRKKRMEKSNSSITGALKSLPGTPREFRFVDLKKATNNFEEKNKLGQGGFGVVYRGHLQKENLEVAVKCFSRESIKGQYDFLAELTIINLLRHKHLVRLLGWCHKNGKLLLVYEYMPNGSLDKHLFGGGANSEPLSWGVRYKIISGVAYALHYLHNEYNQMVLHRDLKASNIMLDSDFDARLGDFGLARALDNEKTSYAEAEGMPGTMGYIAPECILTGKATRQSDVYAFGAVLLEVVSGLRPGTRIGAFNSLVDWVWSLHRGGRLLDAVDERLSEEEFVKEEAHRVLLLGLACSHPIASERPTTHEIVQMISGSVPVPLVPPFKPAFVLPSVPSGFDDISRDTTAVETKSFSTSSQFASGWTRECVSRESHAAPYSDGFNLV